MCNKKKSLEEQKLTVGGVFELELMSWRGNFRTIGQPIGVPSITVRSDLSFLLQGVESPSTDPAISGLLEPGSGGDIFIRNGMPNRIF